MSVDRVERLDSLLRRVIAESVFRMFQSDDFDPGRVTITSVKCAKDLRNATVLVSVFGSEKDRPRVLRKLIRHSREFQSIINREVGLKFTPVLRFELDESLAKGDHVLAVLDRMEHGLPNNSAIPPIPGSSRSTNDPIFTPVSR